MASFIPTCKNVASTVFFIFRHVQFMSESSEGHSSATDTQNQLNAKFVKDTSKYWYKPHISRDDGKITWDIQVFFSVGLIVMLGVGLTLTKGGY